MPFLHPQAVFTEADHAYPGREQVPHQYGFPLPVFKRGGERVNDKELEMFEELKDPGNLMKDNGTFFDRYKKAIPLWWGKIRDALEPIGYYEACLRKRRLTG